jgi:hypothetical protein
MTVERHPLSRWGHPKGDVLRNQVFASGRPPFTPFPTVTNLINANLCPVALYHDLIHGIENALIRGDLRTIKRRGELFHNFIAYLKLSIRNGDFELRGDIPSQISSIQNVFFRFSQSQGFPIGESNDIWRLYIRPWLERKLENGELQALSSDSQIFFEISVANSHVHFPLNDGMRNYPLRGRIDEIDLTQRRIIERTIKGSREDNSPPFLKDYQIWLLWKIICSLEEEHLPSEWRGINFENFELIVETPHQDFVISDNQNFINDTHWAYAWINDLSISESPRVFSEVFENAQCAPENPHPECGHADFTSNTCFPRRYSFPRCRPEIRQTFQPWYRLLLWEQMWKGHLWHYQLLMLDRRELLNLGIIVETNVVSARDNQIELEVSGREANTLRGYEYCTIIPYGTVFCGLKLDARLVSTSNNNIVLQLSGILPTISEEAILLLSPDIPAPIMKEPLIFLEQQMQSALFRLKHIGAQSEERAQRRSLIQLLESIFGTRPLRRGRR